MRIICTLICTDESAWVANYDNEYKIKTVIYSSDKMKVFSLNINGLEEREDEIRLFVQNTDPDVVLLQETKTRVDTLRVKLNYPGKRLKVTKTTLRL